MVPDDDEAIPLKQFATKSELASKRSTSMSTSTQRNQLGRKQSGY